MGGSGPLTGLEAAVIGVGMATSNHPAPAEPESDRRNGERRTVNSDRDQSPAGHLASHPDQAAVKNLKSQPPGTLRRTGRGTFSSVTNRTD
jgi:hypothetical protein